MPKNVNKPRILQVRGIVTAEWGIYARINNCNQEYSFATIKIYDEE